jgi:hypothetical protein
MELTKWLRDLINQIPELKASLEEDPGNEPLRDLVLILTRIQEIAEKEDDLPELIELEQMAMMAMSEVEERRLESLMQPGEAALPGDDEAIRGEDQPEIEPDSQPEEVEHGRQRETRLQSLSEGARANPEEPPENEETVAVKL